MVDDDGQRLAAIAANTLGSAPASVCNSTCQPSRSTASHSGLAADHCRHIMRLPSQIEPNPAYAQTVSKSSSCPKLAESAQPRHAAQGIRMLLQMREQIRVVRPKKLVCTSTPCVTPTALATSPAKSLSARRITGRIARTGHRLLRLKHMKVSNPPNFVLTR